MIDFRRPAVLTWMVLQGLSVNAQTPTQLIPFLPQEQEVKAALFTSPLIDMARSRKDAGQARAVGIEAGSAEVIVRASAQRRQEVLLGSQLHESMVSIERPFRAWGKRGLDADLSKQTLALSEIEYSDALHEATRELVHLWFVYLKALVDQKNAHANLELVQKMYRLTQVQFKQGEISQLDQQLASAEFERAKAGDALAKSQVQACGSALHQRYPSVSLPSELPSLLDKQLTLELPALNESMVSMREEFLSKNHELKMLSIDAKRLQLVAQRASKDTLPDPTFGVFTARERSGVERVSGVLFSMPLPGSARESHARVSYAEAQAMVDKIRLLEQQLGSSFDAMWLQFESKRTALENLRLAFYAQAQAGEKSLKAYTLGEGNLAQTLMISRSSSESLSALERMNLEALELLALIRLDLHQMWDFDE